MEAKRAPEQLKVPVVEYGTQQYRPECDYCDQEATWYHFADAALYRDAYACGDHIGYLNPHTIG